MRTTLTQVALALALAVTSPSLWAVAFTYQGQLSYNGSPATSTYDFEFLLFDAASAGSQVGSTLSLSDVPVTDGIFQVELDFGNAFDGNDYWLEVHVRPGGSTDGYTQLMPRQYLSFTPNAQYAIAASNGPFWKLGGNTGAGRFLGTTDSSALELRVNNQRVGKMTHAVDDAVHAPNILLGSEHNVIEPTTRGATIGGGGGDPAATNCGDGNQPCINTVSNIYGVVSGGWGNYAAGWYSTVGGGLRNTASGYRATVSGGGSNIASGTMATVPGGSSNLAGGDYSFAAGYRAKVRDGSINSNYYSGDGDGDEGTFVWADFTNADFVSTGPNQFLVRASGGIWFGTTSSPSIPAGQFIATSTGAYLADGGTWTNSSDRNRKTNFQPIDPQAVLEKVISLPILRWNYKEEDENTLHLGPMAQDFHAAFGLGADDKHIATVDADGVALAAIQALAQENRSLKGQLAQLDDNHRQQQQKLSQLEREHRQQQQQLAILLADREAQQQQLAQLQQALQALQANQQQLLTRLRQAEGEANTQEPAQ